MDKRIIKLLDEAAGWAAGGNSPSRELIGEVSVLDLPRILKPAETREAIWKILSYPERGRSLAVLNAVDLLVEIFPSWTTEIAIQDARLRAVEEVHLERWACGLGEYAFSRICYFHDAGVDGRLNGWALTSLATLLVETNEEAASYVSSLSLDLTALGATAGEIERIAVILSEFPIVFESLAKAQHKPFKVLPATLIVALATMFADKRFNDDHTAAAILAADRWISQK